MILNAVYINEKNNVVSLAFSPLVRGLNRDALLHAFWVQSRDSVCLDPLSQEVKPVDLVDD